MGISWIEIECPYCEDDEPCEGCGGTGFYQTDDIENPDDWEDDD